jgi:uncharacterized membrane protein
MASSIWLWLSVLVLLAWGALGVFQKKAVSHISAQTALVWAAAGFMMLQPFVYPAGGIFGYSSQSLGWAVMNGVFNGLGFLCIMAAMRHGGKASIVEPLASLYPLFFVVLAPTLLHETTKPLHMAGIGCAIAGGILLCAEGNPTKE